MANKKVDVSPGGTRYTIGDLSERSVAADFMIGGSMGELMVCSKCGSLVINSAHSAGQHIDWHRMTRTN